MNDQQKVHNFLANAKLMVIAVVLADGTPWAVPVRIQDWHGKVFEWDSRVDAQHSQAIAANPIAAVTIFDKGADAQVGFYATGNAVLKAENEGGYGRYEFTATKAWLNDETFVKREVELGDDAH